MNKTSRSAFWLTVGALVLGCGGGEIAEEPGTVGAETLSPWPGSNDCGESKANNFNICASTAYTRQTPSPSYQGWGYVFPWVGLGAASYNCFCGSSTTLIWRQKGERTYLAPYNYKNYMWAWTSISGWRIMSIYDVSR